MTKFNKLWEESTQEEGRIANREEKLNDDEDQALVAHAKKGTNKRKIMINLPEEIKSFKGTQDPRETSHSLHVSHVITWENLQEIVPSKQKNSRRETQSFIQCS